jgi:hypothetical protein
MNVRPLSSLPGWDNSRFAEVFDNFPRAFVNHHAGYKLVRPALLPIVVPRSTANEIWDTTKTCLEAIKKVSAQQFNGDFASLVDMLGYSSNEKEWLVPMGHIEPINLATTFARCDFVIGCDGPRLVEINVGPTIGGIGILDRYWDVFKSMAGTFLATDWETRISMPRPTQIWIDCLKNLVTATERKTMGQRIRIALVVADEETTVPHPHEAAWYLNNNEIDAEVVQVKDIYFGPSHAESPTGPVDILYGCFTYDQFGIPAYRQFAERAMAGWNNSGTLYIAPPIFTIFGNKAMLTYISKDIRKKQAARLFTKTYRINSDMTYRAKNEKNQFVLKPAIGYGGEGIVIGCKCTQSEWNRLLDRASARRQSYVLQEYIAPIPICLPTGESIVSYNVVIGCLSFGGHFSGLLLRHIPTENFSGVTNCKQGATFAAALIAEDI